MGRDELFDLTGDSPDYLAGINHPDFLTIQRASRGLKTDSILVKSIIRSELKTPKKKLNPTKTFSRISKNRGTALVDNAQVDAMAVLVQTYFYGHQIWGVKPNHDKCEAWLIKIYATSGKKPEKVERFLRDL